LHTLYYWKGHYQLFFLSIRLLYGESEGG